MTQEEQQGMEGKIAGLELALEALIKEQLLSAGRDRFATTLYNLSIVKITPPPPPSFQTGLTKTLQHLASKLKS